MSFCILFFVFSPIFISNISTKYLMKYWAEPGLLFYFYTLHFFVFSFISSCLLFYYYNKSSGKIKTQLKIILWGVILGYIGGSTNYFLWYNINIYPYGNILVSLFVIFSAYAIAAHHLMDITLVIRKSTVSLLSFSTILLPSLTIIYIAYLFSPSLAFWLLPVFLSLSAISFPHLKTFYYNFANKYFFSSLYDPKKIIETINDALSSTSNSETIYGIIYKILSHAMHFKSFAVLKYDEDLKQYYVISLFNKKLSGKKRGIYLANTYLHENYIKQNKAIVTYRSGNKKYRKEIQPTLKILSDENMEVLVPLASKGQVHGLLAIGPKESGEIYSQEDIKVLETVGSMASMAMENTIFCRRMESKVEERSNIIKNMQERQKQAMVDISHNLQTPLSVLKNEIENFRQSAPFNSRIRYMEASVNKVSTFIYDLMKLTKIETEIDCSELDTINLSEMLSELFEYYQIVANDKGLIITDHIEPNILVKGNQKRLDDMITNLVSNAVKFIPKGCMIKISLKKKYDMAELIVQDNGPGIPKEELNHIFDRYYRVKKMKDCEGSGLGLAICRKIAELHQGDIVAQSEIGKGTKMTVTIPFIPMHIKL